MISIGFFSQWSSNGIISYFLPKVFILIGITNGTTQLQINFILQAINVISATGICFFVDKIGRRPIFLTSSIGMLCCVVSMTISLARYGEGGHSDTNAGHAFLVFMFLFYIVYNIGFSGMLVSYSIEIMPYRLRAKGLTLMFLCVSLSLWFNQYINPIALKAIGWKYYLVYCIWDAFEVFVVWKYYIETKQTPLEEIARFFDGDAAIIGGAVANEKSRVLAAEHDNKLETGNPVENTVEVQN